jgi:hypothetical protein
MTSRALLIFVPIVAGCLLAGPAPAAARQAPWFGVWQLAPPAAVSRFDPPPYKKVTSTIEPWQDGLKVTYDMVRARGGITHMEWTGRFDGRDYPVQGVGYFLTNAYRPIDARSYEIIIKVDGAVAATATAVVSPDGARLTVTTVEKDARGQDVRTTAVYTRQ